MTSGHNANSPVALNMILLKISEWIMLFLRGDQSTVNSLKLNSFTIFPLVNPDGYEYMR